MHRSTVHRMIKIAAAYGIVALVVLLGWLWRALPDRIILEPGQPLVLQRFFWVEPLRSKGSRNVASTRAVGSYQTTLALGGWLPLKTIRTQIMERPIVTVCGIPFGVKMFSEGALVVGFTEIHTRQGAAVPAKRAGLRLGDRVIRVGQTETQSNDEIAAALEKSGGNDLRVVYIRDGRQCETTLTPVWDTQAQQWRAGMWVRDSSAGVGTLTFVNEADHTFGGLGHPISDNDTGESIALRSGEIVACEIVGCTKGTAGSPGELKGRFVGSHALGTIQVNSSNGVYGTTRTEFTGQKMAIAFAQEIHTGKAQILTTTMGRTPQIYTVEIEKINDSNSNRNMILRVTDKRLLAQTGGIVQGMGVIDNRDNTKKPGNTGFFSSYPKNDPTIGV